MKIGDMRCPWHPDMTLFECQHLHEGRLAIMEIEGPEGADGGEEA